MIRPQPLQPVNRRSSRGAALVMALLLVAILAVICAEVLYQFRVHRFIVVNHQQKLQARYIAKAGQNAADTLLLYKDADDPRVFNIPEAPFFRYSCLSVSFLPGLGLTSAQEKKREDMLSDLENMENCGRWSLSIPYVLDDIPLDMEITDEQAKLNLNAFLQRVQVEETDPRAGEINFTYNEPLFHAVFELFRLQALRHEIPLSDDELRHMLILLRDYIDYGNINGSFDTDLVSYFDYGDRIIKMKNGPLDSLEELRYLPDMSDELFEAVRPYLTVYPTGREVAPPPGQRDRPGVPDLAGSDFDPRVNVAAAPVEVIYALLMASSYLGGHEPTMTIEQALEIAQQVAVENYTKNQVQFPELMPDGKPTGTTAAPAPPPADPLATLSPQVRAAFNQMKLENPGGRPLRFWRVRSSALTDDGFETVITTVVKVNKVAREIVTLYFRED